MTNQGQGRTPPERGAATVSRGEYALPQKVNLAVGALTMAGFAGFTAFIVLYAAFGNSFVQGLERSIGDVLMEEGIRLEEAQEHENAILVYTEALDSRFTHSENRTKTLVRLGRLLLSLEGPEPALPYLEEAYENGGHLLSLYASLCTVLSRAGRMDEALAYGREWFERARESGNQEHQARAKLFEGRMLQGQGAAERALEAFVEGHRARPGGLNSFFAGLLSDQAGEQENALQYLEVYLQDATGKNAERARRLRTRILRGMEQK